MKRIVAFGFFILVSGCQNKVTQEDIALLNGYWEIEKVTMANGQTKDYKVNTTIDYIKIKDLSGFKKKVYPKFDGTYDTSNDAEMFTIVGMNNDFEIHYKNELSEWVEKINSIDDSRFSVTNEENITYFYKRFEPFKVSG